MHELLKFPSKVLLELDSIITGEYSFGGMTAIVTARSDYRIKACIKLDHWVFTYQKEINQGDFYLKKPFYTVSTEAFHPFCQLESWKTFKNSFNNSKVAA